MAQAGELQDCHFQVFEYGIVLYQFVTRSDKAISVSSE